MRLKIIYENEDILATDKPAGIIIFPENKINQKTLIDYLLEKLPYLKNVGQPPRYGIAHRLDKDTSGILLVAKNNKTLEFLQKQFKTGKVLKKYLALVVGSLKTNQGEIETLIGRSPKDRKKQKAFSFSEPAAKRKGKRLAITEYQVLKKFKDYTLAEVSPKTGRKHQIRVHFAHLGHPVAGDKIYGFKRQSVPQGLTRHFLHAIYLKVKLPNSQVKEFHSPLTEDLKKILNKLKEIN